MAIELMSWLERVEPASDGTATLDKIPPLQQESASPMVSRTDRRARKNQERKRRRDADAQRKHAQRDGERSLHHFVGVQDGAPDDQLNPARGPDAWHTLGVVVGPSEKHLLDFCEQIRQHAGHPKFTLRKWNGPSKDHRAAHQQSFIRGFAHALANCPQVHVFIFAMQAKDIELMWYGAPGAPDCLTFLGINGLDGWGQLRTRPSDGKTVVHWGPFQTISNGKLVTHEFDMDPKRAALIAYTYSALLNLYEHAGSDLRRPPVWDLLCDHLPGDPQDRGLAVLLNLLKAKTGARIRLHSAKVGGRSDGDTEILADCVATWAKECVEKPHSRNGTALRTLIALTAHDSRIHFRLKTGVELPAFSTAIPPPNNAESDG
jgi:hypothetical protein